MHYLDMHTLSPFLASTPQAEMPNPAVVDYQIRLSPVLQSLKAAHSGRGPQYLTNHRSLKVAVQHARDNISLRSSPRPATADGRRS